MNPHPDCTILAIGTSTERCSVALLQVRDGQVSVRDFDERPQRGHSGHVLAMLRRLLGESALDGAGLDVVAFDAGPGAFTGLRIGCGVAQGLGFAWTRPVVAVGSLEAIALQGGDGDAWVAIDARMGEVYAGIARIASGRARLLHGPVVLGPGQARAWFESAAGAVDRAPGSAVGDGFVKAPALAELAASRGLPVAGERWPDAASVARQALAQWREDGGRPAEEAAPRYVRDKVALDVDEQARLRAGRAA